MKRNHHYAERARELRANAGAAEQRMWSILRAKRIGGFKFRRQHALGPYIADFVCLQAQLVIEIDGDTHGTDEREDLDAKRSEYIERLGFRVIRFWNDDVLTATEGVVETIAGALGTDVPSTSATAYPSPLTAGGYTPATFRPVATTRISRSQCSPRPR